MSPMDKVRARHQTRGMAGGLATPKSQEYADLDMALHALDCETLRADTERERVLAKVEALRAVLDPEESLLRQLSEWLRGES